MKKAKNALLLALCAVLLVGATIAGTMAYLTSKTEVVNNTFTAGNVTITLDEAKVTEYGVAVDGAARVTTNEYKLIPGHTYAKDPTIHVADGSEDCWVFAKLVNGLGNNATIVINSGWTQVAPTEDGGVVYAYNTKLSAADQSTQSTAPLFSQFTFAGTANPKACEDASITIIGYAVQADGFTSAEAAWAAAPATWTAN